MGQSVKDFEQKVYEHLKREGFDVLRSGYPDFMVKRNGRYSGVCAIEVKQGSDKVRPNQTEMHDMFKDAGIPVYVVRPEDLYGENNTAKIKPKAKFRFKKIVTATHYNDMISRINALSSRFNTEKSVYVSLIEGAMKDMADVGEKVESLMNSIKVESVILKEDNLDGDAKK
jgi:hypothetical protein